MKVGELKEEMNARFSEVDARFAEVDSRFDSLEWRIAAEHKTTRRHMDVLIEQVKAEYRLGLDKMTAIEQRLASSIASNAAEHGAFVTVLHQHEGRITTLERKHESSEPPS